MSVNTLLKCMTMALAMVMASKGVADAGCSMVILNYPGSRLLIDDNDCSHGGVDTIMVRPGAHNLSLCLPPKEGVWMPPLVQRRFMQAEDETLLIDPEHTALLNIRTTPERARAFLNGQYLDIAPLSITTVRGIDRTVRVEKEGYRSVTIDLDHEALQRSVLVLSLDPVQTAVGHEASMDTGEESGKNLPGWLPYTTFSYFVISTALGFHSRSRADELYEDYLSSSSREQMNRLYDQSRTMDNRARILWITGEIALGASIYLFAREFWRHDAKRSRYPLSLDLSRRTSGDVFLSVVYGGKGH